DELEEVVGAARLRANARHSKAAEGLAGDEGAGDAAVDVEVADAELALGPLEVRGLAREDAARELVRAVVGDGQGVLEGLGVQDGDDGPEDLFLGDGVVGLDVGEDGWRDKGGGDGGETGG